VDSSDFRRLIGHWATGVSVVTAHAADGPAGATANALTSLSLTPPCLLVCFDVSSRTLHAVRESERFGINILAVEQEQVSRLFATKRSQEEKFAEVGYRLEHGVPVLSGCLAWLACGLESELQRGDHVIAIGNVLGGEIDESAEPLLFYRSTYTVLRKGSEASR
jgi:3-hydroxy-9,10-secoandrosta-1,3,5(10)-triene-9,17-dione monooxygenase reductase component